MSKKSLLEEGTIRRFMKLAGTDVMAGGFLAEENKGHGPGKETKPGANVVPAGSRWLKEQEEEEEVDVDVEAGGEELDMAMGDEDLGMDLEEPPEEGDEDETSVEGFARDVLDAIKDVAEEHGVEMEVELGGEEELEEEQKYGGNKGDIPDKDRKKQGHHGRGPKRKETAKEEGEGDYGKLAEVNYIDEDALLSKVYSRVSNRILREKKADDMASMLADKISKRLRKR